MRLFPLIVLALMSCRAKESVDSELEPPDDSAPTVTDADGDGYDLETDCDDGDANINPGASEVPYDGFDNDCDEATPDDDLDGDGFLREDDCDDEDARVRPDAAEACNGIDDNCDGVVDDGVGLTFYADQDGDGFGDPSDAVQSCEGNAGYVADASDCDDGDAAVNIAADERCDGIDNDCDAAVDEPEAVDADVWYADTDGDGYGDVDFDTPACSQPSGYVGDARDCDDTDPSVHPGAPEVCDGADQDCDGTSDEDATDASTWYVDYDADGYGATRFTQDACEQPSGYVDNADDCDDTDGDVNPDAAEVCNAIDDDCDGLTDDADPDGPSALTWYADLDGDGYGDEGDAGSQACEVPANGSEDNTDCDDTDASVHPGATEVWYDGVDADCDGASDYDADGDGYESFAEIGGEDCVDDDASVFTCGNSQATAGQTCLDILNTSSSAPDGVYWLDPDGDGDTSDAWQGWCDMTRDGGGWTLVVNNTQAVTHSGNPTMTQAINDVLVRGGTLGSSLTSFDLWVGVAEWGDIGTSSRIEVGASPSSLSHQAFYTLSLNASADYRLTMSGGTISLGGNAPGIYAYHNGSRLSTYDDDNDSYSGNCASYYGHPWWYNSCWSGSFWGGTSHQEAPYWATSGSDYYAWGAIWLQ
ncbi:MAG: hypothetical protein H6740_16340 [Alphaproteobacteria bacterium]|nr:hypothetical protein [Alphaproteobacteria bacterium]